MQQGSVAPLQLRAAQLHRKIVSLRPKTRADSRLAMMELRMVLASFVWTFDVELAEEGQAEPYFVDAFITLRGPCPVRISPRFKA